MLPFRLPPALRAISTTLQRPGARLRDAWSFLFRRKTWAQYGRRFALVTAAAAIVASSIFSPLASAKTAADMTPSEEMRSWLYAKALSYCIDNRMIKDTSGLAIHNRITEAHAKAGTYFYTKKNDTNPDISYVLKAEGVSIATDKGAGVLCDDTGGWVLDAAALWGYSDGIDLLCDMGARRANGSDCRDGAGEFKGTLAPVGGGGLGGDMLNSTTFKDNINKRVYGGKDPTLSGAASYVLARDAFFTGCLGLGAGSATSIPADYTGSASDAFLFKNVKVVDPTTDQITNSGSGSTFYGTKKQTDKISYYNTNFGNISATCQDLASDMGKYAAAYSTWIKKNPDTPDTSGNPTTATPGGDTDTSSSCKIDGVGWILCPALNFITGLTDNMYGLVQNWLEVEPSLVSNNSGTSRGWGAMRDLANAGIVIVFIVIILSQLTGLGISNYGIKKMLPRLIIVAILANLSFYLMQICVDVSNIVGGTLKDFFGSAAVFEAADSGSSWLDSGNMFTDVLAALIGGQAIASLGVAASAGAIFYGGVGFFILILLSAFLAVAFVFFLLAFRKALIVILIVLAPLALLAMVLPNTRSLYAKWQKVFIALLVIYPMIALLFGGSEMAANIILQNSTDSGDVSSGIMTAIMALGIATVPLFATIPMLKSSLNAVPIVGGALQKLQGRLSKPLDSAIGKRGQAARQGMGAHARDTALRGGFGSSVQGLARGKLRRENRLGGYSHSVNKQSVEYMAGYTANDPNASEAERAVAVSKLAKLNEEEAKAKKTLLELDINGKPIAPEVKIDHLSNQLTLAIQHGDATLAQQATAALRTAGAPGRARLEQTLLANDSALSGAQGYGSDVSRAIRQDLVSNNIKANNNALSRWATSAVEKDAAGNVTGYKSLRTMVHDENNMTGLTIGEQASQDTPVLERQRQYIDPGDATAILNNESIAEKSLNSDKVAIFRAAAPRTNPGNPVGGSPPPQEPRP